METIRPSLTLKLLALAMFIFLLAPLFLVVPISFSADMFMKFPPSGWSVKWYAAIFADSGMIKAFRNSFFLAVTVTALSLLIAIPAAYALTRLNLRFSVALLSFLTAPLLLPLIVLGLAILIIFASQGLLATYTGLTIAHLVIVLPYALRVLTTSLLGLPIVVEEAAATLGATPLRTFRHVTLPLMLPGIVAAAALSFLVSFDEVVLSLFLTGPRMSTLPVEMYHHVERQADPMVAAISCLLIIFTLAVVLVVDRSVGLGKTFVK